jgi:hypothetical protein
LPSSTSCISCSVRAGTLRPVSTGTTVECKSMTEI